jgi:hypothetical protein
MKKYKSFLLALLAKKREEVVHFLGFAQKMNHISSCHASEASAKLNLEIYVEF